MKDGQFDFNEIAHDTMGHLSQMILGLGIIEKFMPSECEDGKREIKKIKQQQTELETILRKILTSMSRVEKGNQR